MKASEIEQLSIWKFVQSSKIIKWCYTGSVEGPAQVGAKNMYFILVKIRQKFQDSKLKD